MFGAVLGSVKRTRPSFREPGRCDLRRERGDERVALLRAGESVARGDIRRERVPGRERGVVDQIVEDAKRLQLRTAKPGAPTCHVEAIPECEMREYRGDGPALESRSR